MLGLILHVYKFIYLLDIPDNSVDLKKKVGCIQILYLALWDRAKLFLIDLRVHTLNALIIVFYSFLLLMIHVCIPFIFSKKKH